MSLISCQGRYAADQRSYKQEFRNTPQEGLFLVDSERFHFFFCFPETGDRNLPMTRGKLSCFDIMKMHFLALVGGAFCVIV